MGPRSPCSRPAAAPSARKSAPAGALFWESAVRTRIVSEISFDRVQRMRSSAPRGRGSARILTPPTHCMQVADPSKFGAPTEATEGGLVLHLAVDWKGVAKEMRPLRRMNASCPDSSPRPATYYPGATTSNTTETGAPSSTSCAERTAFLIGKTYEPEAFSGNTEVAQVDVWIVAFTRTEPKPRRCSSDSSLISSAHSTRSVAKCHALSPGTSRPRPRIASL